MEWEGHGRTLRPFLSPGNHARRFCLGGSTRPRLCTSYKNLFHLLSPCTSWGEAFWKASEYFLESWWAHCTTEKIGQPTGMNSIVFLSCWFIVRCRGKDEGFVSRGWGEIYFTAFAIKSIPCAPNIRRNLGQRPEILYRRWSYSWLDFWNPAPQIWS